MISARHATNNLRCIYGRSSRVPRQVSMLPQPAFFSSSAQFRLPPGLHKAAYFGDVDVLQRKMKQAETREQQEAAVNAKDRYGKTPMHYAVARRNAAMAVALGRAGAAVDAQAPLYCARVGFAAVLEALLQCGVDVNHVDTMGRSAAYYAVAFDHADCLQLLLDADADCSSREVERDQTVLMDAARLGRTDCLKMILEADPSQIDAIDVDGKTALYWAVVFRHTECVKELLKHGASVDIRYSEGLVDRLTILMVAVRMKSAEYEIVKELLKYHNKTNVDKEQDVFGNNALYWALKKNAAPCIVDALC